MLSSGVWQNAILLIKDVPHVNALCWFCCHLPYYMECSKEVTLLVWHTLISSSPRLPISHLAAILVTLHKFPSKVVPLVPPTDTVCFGVIDQYKLFWLDRLHFLATQSKTYSVLHRASIQCFPKVARVADHVNRVADQLPHFSRPNDPQNLNWGEGPWVNLIGCTLQTCFIYKKHYDNVHWNAKGPCIIRT